MSPQEEADLLLTAWQIQRRAGIPANEVVLPEAPANEWREYQYRNEWSEYGY